jgi:hypothetical protein
MQDNEEMAALRAEVAELRGLVLTVRTAQDADHEGLRQLDEVIGRLSARVARAEREVANLRGRGGLALG